MLYNVFKNDKSIKKENYIYILLLVFVIGGVVGFIYEEIFYKIDLGYFVKRGSTLGPWIPIYGFGSLFLTMFCYRLKKHPVLIFVLSFIVTGLIEFGTALVCDKIFHVRLWDYNVEIWNFGNINGYICLRSVTLFALAGLMLVYVVIPKVNKLLEKYNLRLTSVILSSLFVFDIILFKFIK